MLAGIFLHASLCYATQEQEFWPLKDTNSSMWFGHFYSFIHLFRMPLFFFVAGFFANLLIQKNGALGFFKNRALRLALPFVLFLPPLLIALYNIALFIRDYIPANQHSTLLRILFAGLEDGKNAVSPSTSHLWFIYNLMMFCTLCALLQRLKKTKMAKLLRRIFAALYHTPAFIMIVPLVLVPALYSVAKPMPTPDMFWPQAWSFGFYGIFFVLGWHFFYHQEFLDRIKIWILPMAILVILLFFNYSASLPINEKIENIEGLTREQLDMVPPGHSWSRFVGAFLGAYLGVFLVFLSLYCSRALLNFQNSVTRYISDASYWVYIIHLPLLLFFQALLTPYSLPLIVKFMASTAAVFIISFASYHWLVRYTWVGSMLNGKKTRQSLARPETAHKSKKRQLTN